MDTETTMRMQYLGVLKLLAETSMHLSRSDPESHELRDTMERVFTDAQAVIPRLRWRRILNRFEIELVQETP